VNATYAMSDMMFVMLVWLLITLQRQMHYDIELIAHYMTYIALQMLLICVVYKVILMVCMCGM
jgi:hypothetical protein